MHFILRVVAILALLAVGGCIHVEPGVGASKDTGGCCERAERQPRWLVALIEPTAPLTGRIVPHIVWRRGHLDRHVTATTALDSVLQPLDIILVRNGGSLSSRSIPGLFSHSTVYLGTDGDLGRLGVWNDEGARRHRDAIRHGKTMIEADFRGVHLATRQDLMNTDRLLVLRADFAGRSCRRRTTLALLAHLGTPFDFHFDGATGERLFCTELIDHVAPDLRLPRRRVYGRDIILPDELAQAGIRGGRKWRAVLYLKGDRDGWQRASMATLRHDLDEAWRR